MRTDDGFVHAWTLDAELVESTWVGMHAEIVQVLRAASLRLERGRPGDALAMLRGPEGFGHLILSAEEIAFNGNAFLGQSGDPFSIERVARRGILARVGGSGRRTVRRCDTRGHPYDLAVAAALLVILRHLGDRVRVGTSGSLRSGWGAAAALVRETLGECGQLVQLESGALGWVNSPISGREAQRNSSSA